MSTDGLTEAQRELEARATGAGELFRTECAAWDLADEAPYPRVLGAMRSAGLLGLTMPREYGGQGLTALDYLVATSALFRSSQTWLCCEPLFGSSGPGPTMILLGEERTRDKFLPDLVSGTRGCNIALTEPDAGSALTDLSTTAHRETGGVRVSGVKSFVTGATLNDLHAVFVRFDGVAGAKGIGAVIIDDSMPGVTVERGPRFIGDRGIPHGNVILDDVLVPEENIIIGPGSFARLMGAFNMERLHNCAFWLGSSLAAWDEASRYVASRRAFGRAVIEFQSVYHDLAMMWTEIEALKLLSHRAAASATDGRFPDMQLVTMAKLFGATIGPRITAKCMELHGGIGATYDAPIQRIHRDAMANVVAGGAPAILKTTIAKTLFPDFAFPQAP